ncbi:conserved domain protein [Ruminococcus sp. CAG:579]|nr:conserved domain protein [Ruminococcus sp. CAG:579]
MDKAQINSIVKMIKKSRAESNNSAEQTEGKASFQLGSKPEKVMIGLGLAAGLAIFFDDSRKRKKHPERARGYFRRCYDNYQKLGGLLDSTIAKNIKDQKEREFKDDMLEDLTIEKAIDFDLD